MKLAGSICYLILFSFTQYCTANEVIDGMGNLPSEGVKYNRLYGITYLPKDGIIPDEHVAIDVAKVLLTHVYGAKLMSYEYPLNAELIDGVWLVKGTYNGRQNTAGGVAKILIRKDNGLVLGITHEK